MRAILVREFGGPDVLKIEPVPDPPPPGAGQLLVRIRAAGVNPVDAYIRSGTYARKPPLPYVPGSDGAGEVEAIGPGVETFAPGDRVYVFGTAAGLLGTCAERAVCGVHQVHALPARLSFAQGAAVGVPCITAYRGLFQRAGARPGETVLVHGATGAVGTAAVQLARAAGMCVIGTGGTERGRQLVRDLGAALVVDHGAAGYADEILRATGGRGVDVVLEMAAHVNLDRDLTLLAPRGRVVVIGNRGRIEIDPRQTMARDAAVLGMTLFNVNDADMASIHAGLGAALRDGTLTPVVAREMPLADAPRAHEAVTQPGASGKIVLAVT